MFKKGWNSHKIAGTRGKSPLQLYAEGMLTTKHSGVPALDYYYEVDFDYGYSDEGVVPDMTDDNRVIVPPVDINLTSQQLQLMQNQGYCITKTQPMHFSSTSVVYSCSSGVGVGLVYKLRV